MVAHLVRKSLAQPITTTFAPAMTSIGGTIGALRKRPSLIGAGQLALSNGTRAMASGLFRLLYTPRLGSCGS